MRSLPYVQYTKYMRPLLHQFDSHITKSIQQWPDWVHPLMSFASFIGHPVFTVGIGAAALLVGWGRSNLRLFLAGLVVVTTIGIGTVLKLLFGRARPLTDYVLAMRFDLSSFPSGHTVGSTVAYGLFAYLLWQLLPATPGYIVAAILIALIIVVGLSRIYLGAHHPSDVVAGWLLGIVALAVIIFVIQPKL